MGSKVKADDVVIPPGWEKLTSAGTMRLPGDGDHLRCSGLIGVGPDGTVAPDAEVQFRHAFERVAAVLAAAGLGFADILEMTSFSPSTNSLDDLHGGRR